MVWRSHSERPHVNELGCALAVERGSASIGTSNVSVIEIVLGYSLT